MADTINYSKKLELQSNSWYNDGLQKAKIHDLSGAITSLKNSLQLNRENIDARNLLGLMYYGRGEIADALVEWIISKNLKNHENIANYYIKKVQESPNELEAVNMAIQKYNQSLTYCQQDGDDLAIIQLKKVLHIHPFFLRAYQLLGLLYLKTEQFSKARHALKRAHKIDTTNDITLRYMHELSLHRKQAPQKKRAKKEETITYTLGNETIIQPISAVMKETSPMHTILNIMVGVAIGAAVIWFLAVPSAKQGSAETWNEQVGEFSSQIETQKGQISALKKELEDYRAVSGDVAEEREKAASAQESYEAVLTVETQLASGSVSDNDMVTTMLDVNNEVLGTQGQEKYDSITKELYPRVCAKRYKAGKANYEAANYEEAVVALEQVVAMEEGYEEGSALLYLGHAKQGQGDSEKAKELYNKVIELYPNTPIAKEADNAIKGNTDTQTNQSDNETDTQE